MTSLREAEEELAHALRTIEPHTRYAEVMAESAEGVRLRHDKESTDPVPAPRMRGAVFRAWSGSSWVETATTGLDSRSLNRAADGLVRAIAKAPGTLPPPGEPSTGDAEAATPVRESMFERSLVEHLEFAKTLFGWATSVPGIGNAIVNLGYARDERCFRSTAGARRFQTITRTSASIVPLAIENGRVEYDFLSHGGTGGREVLATLTEAKIREVALEAKALLATKAKAPTGSMTVLLDPGTAGTFAHESFGHGTEADQLVRDRSYLKPLLGQRLGPECLTLVDDGSMPGKWGSMFFDDEGHRSQRTVLVDHGVFREVLHDRETAAVMHRTPTGNARRADFLSRPFVRMTNTFVEPGEFTFDELVEEAKDGVILQSCTSGIEDPLGGNMQIKVKKGRRIEHGKVTEILPSMALSGKVLEVLASVRGASRSADFDMSPGFCGKGHTDLLPVSSGGPYLLARAVVGPA
ncbi:MAG: TldD/PmbA family protein [Thermoplasmata archaeon]|nr:TldD/PmbA family protein [Thermoplasmata archaeon]